MKIMKKADSTALLERGVEEVIVRENLKKRLVRGDKLRVKFGIDPTAPDIHLGHSVVLRKLRQFQDAGHTVVLIIGDFTARIGDPSGRNEMRKPLSPETIKENMKSYLKEAGLIVDVKKAEVRYNSEWHEKKGLAHLLSITQSATVQQVLKRDDFKKRLDADTDIAVLELLYPILQGYDSVEVRADLEVGGTDQKFNLLMGRRVQRHFDLPEQDVMTFPLLEGTDGVKKMSKSAHNYIALTDAPADMFGKIMAVPDALLPKYYTLLTDLSFKEGDPYAAKLTLAETIVKMYHSEKKASAARDAFINTFSKKEVPDEIEIVEVPKKILSSGTLATLAHLEAKKSKSELRRLLSQGAIKVDGKVVKDQEEKRSDGEVLKIGKKEFKKIQAK